MERITWGKSIQNTAAVTINYRNRPTTEVRSTLQCNMPVVEILTDECTPILDTRKISHEDWLGERLHCIGGSSVGDILCPDDYGTALTSYLKMRGDLVEDISDKPAVKRGNRLEDGVLVWFQEEFEARTGVWINIYKSPFIYQNNDRKYQKINIDGIAWINELVLEDGTVVQGWVLLEVKTASLFMKKKWTNDNSPIDDVSGELPDRYYYQIQYYLSGLGIDWCILPVWFDGDIHWRVIPRNKNICTDMYEKLDNFYSDYEKGILPEPDGYAVEHRYIDKALENIDPEDINDEEIDSIVEDYYTGKKEVSSITEKLEPSMKEAERIITQSKLKLRIRMSKMKKKSITIDGYQIDLNSKGDIKIKRSR